MSEIEWRDEFGRSQIGATYNQIIDFERSFGFDCRISFEPVLWQQTAPRFLKTGPFASWL